MPGDGLKTCRYLTEDRATGGCRCAYWGDNLRGNEDMRCHPGGWEGYEAPGGYGQIIPWDVRILASAQLGLENGPPQRTDVETLWQILNIIVKAPGWEVVCAECKRHPPTQWWPNGDWLCGICYELRCGPEPPR